MSLPKLPPLPAPAAFKFPASAVEKQNKSASASGYPLQKQTRSAQALSAKEKEQAKLKKACQDFEAVFLNQMLTKMRESIPKSDLMGSDREEGIYRGMLDEELSKKMAASGGMGLADVLYRQLSDRI